MLGGGSAINAGVAKRARPNDFARWKQHGIEGWAFAEVLKVYKALENTRTGEDGWHGRSGPFPIRQRAMQEVTPALRAFVDASITAGFNRIDDFNGPSQYGVGIDPFNVIDRIRQNTGMVYLTTGVRKCPNLTIRGEAQVDRIEFEGKCAARVRLISGEAFEAGEIILCAGTYGSPAILMLSEVTDLNVTIGGGLAFARSLAPMHELIKRAVAAGYGAADIASLANCSGSRRVLPRDNGSRKNSLWINRFGGLETITRQTLPVPEVGPGEVLIRVESAGVAVWDAFEREGGFAERSAIEPKFPYVLGSDGAGTVATVGEHVSRLQGRRPSLHRCRPRKPQVRVLRPVRRGSVS